MPSSFYTIPNIFWVGVDSWEVQNVSQVLLFLFWWLPLNPRALLDWVHYSHVKKNFFHGSTCKVDKRGSFVAQNTSLPLKNWNKGFSSLHRAHFFYKGKSSKYKGNFGFFVFHFLGMLINVFATLKPGAALLRSCRFHRHPY